MEFRMRDDLFYEPNTDFVGNYTPAPGFGRFHLHNNVALGNAGQQIFREQAAGPTPTTTLFPMQPNWPICKTMSLIYIPSQAMPNSAIRGEGSLYFFATGVHLFVIYV
jgi:hypothetical protein